MGRVSKYRSNQIAKSAIGRKNAQQCVSNSFTGNSNKKDSIKVLMERHTKNSR